MHSKQLVVSMLLYSSIERRPLSLPVKSGRMGLIIFSNIADMEYINSRKLTDSLTKFQMQQSRMMTFKKKLKIKLKYKKNQLYATSLQEIIVDLPTEKVKLNEINQQKGASQHCCLRFHLKKKITYLKNNNFGISSRSDMDPS